MAADPLHNERMLFARMAKGDEQAFREVFDLYRVQLYTFVVHLVHSTADAEEIVQETFMKLWKNRSTLTQVEYPGKYIYTMARNKTLNHLAKIARDRKLLKQLWRSMHPADHVEQLLAAKESQALIEDALSRLSPQKQMVFRLSRYQGLSHEEIAMQLKLSRSRVKNILVEVLKYIRAYLSKHAALLVLLFWISFYPIPC